jgi:hypothetical protein
MPITKGFRALVDEAMAQVTTYNVDQVRQRLDDPALQLVDIRDARELEREGTVPGAINAPRGMLEFWVDPGFALLQAGVRRRGTSSTCCFAAPAGAARWPPRRCRTWA